VAIWVSRHWPWKIGPGERVCPRLAHTNARLSVVKGEHSPQGDAVVIGADGGRNAAHNVGGGTVRHKTNMKLPPSLRR